MSMPSFVAGLHTNKISVTDFLETGKLKPIILVDVRSPDEYAVDRIEHSFSVPLDDIQDGVGIEKVQAIAQANLQPNCPEPLIVLYCEICPGAIRAYQRLKKTGLNLAVLQGGLTAWRQSIPAAKDTEVLARISGSAA
jgi:rhodanese-related sulfurtransferase